MDYEGKCPYPNGFNELKYIRGGKRDKDSFKLHSFNQYESDMLEIDRDVKDTRNNM